MELKDPQYRLITGDAMRQQARVLAWVDQLEAALKSLTKRGRA